MSSTAPQQATFAQRIGAWGYRVLCCALRGMNLRWIALAGRGAGYLVWACAPSRRRIVARNLRITVDPMLRGRKLRSMVRRNMVRTTMNLACALKTGLLDDREFAAAISMEGEDFFEQAGLNGCTGISCIPHAGNWEILARIRPRFAKVEHFGSMYRRLSNPLLEKLVYDARTGFGCEMFSKEDGLKAVLRLARTGGLLGVLSDQFTQEGLHLPYFGKVTGVTPLPALLYRRCKGKGKLLSVFTRNTGLGQWQAVLNREIELPPGCTSDAAITYEVNKALEICQNDNILDGFWMHHRWKATAVFAPSQNKETQAIAAQHYKLPFRFIVCMPERMEEALYVLPMLRVLKQSRVDAQVTVACPAEQENFWLGMKDCVDHVVTTDGGQNVTQQLEADALYREGPYDYLFMFSENKKVFRHLRKLMPIFVSGFADNPLSRRFRVRHPRARWGAPLCKAEDYLRLLEKAHELKFDRALAYTPIAGADAANGVFLAPFSTLGQADRWPEANWAELVRELRTRHKGAITLLALPEDEKEAQALAMRLNVDYRVTTIAELPQLLGHNCHLYAVDGLLAQAASMLQVQGCVILASRLAKATYPEGGTLKTIWNHVPCHPCGRTSCDAACCCTAAITAEQLLEV